jgi:hypothetical protein
MSPRFLNNLLTLIDVEKNELQTYSYLGVNYISINGNDDQEGKFILTSYSIDKIIEALKSIKQTSF